MNDLTRIVVRFFAGLLLLPRISFAQDDVANVASERVHLADKQDYFLIGDKTAKPAALLVVLPGGDGSDQFNPFVRRIWLNALPQGWAIAELVAVPAKPDPIVWPTEKQKAKKQTFSTESFITAVVADASKRRAIDAERVYALAWSSSGPAVYASALSDSSPLRGWFIAMSVFQPNSLPPLTAAKDRKFYLLQSPQDQVTPIHFAQAAKTALTKAGAIVELKLYPGAHGWPPDVYDQISAGINWLEHPPTTQPGDSSEKKNQ